MQCWQPGTVEVINFTNGSALKRIHKTPITHTVSLIYTLSTKPPDYRFLRNPPQALMVQLISNANQKWRDCVLLTRFCSFPQTIVALRQSRPGCPLSLGHCGAAVGAHFVPPHVVRQQTPLSTTTTPTVGGEKKQVNPLERLGTHLHLLQTQRGLHL